MGSSGTLISKKEVFLNGEDYYVSKFALSNGGEVIVYPKEHSGNKFIMVYRSVGSGASRFELFDEMF
ncbi:MAG: hypothetical protein GTN76_11150, partial [Candidatus Aenigmarchaeota archaeon]|nr:hypothetical protein [Candidatus Aenigmarchaeota archaeon]